jgi:zinc and cadmium transporter
MNPGLLPALLSAFIISLGSIAGIFTLSLKKEHLSQILLFLVSLSAGTLMGGAFLHLLPEAVENLQPLILFSTVLLAFVMFFLIEKIFHWRHCHKGECDVHSFGTMNLIGDSIHNFIDGLIIAATFSSSIHLGIITTVAVALHEIPQEIGDFGVLLYSGFNRRKALLANFAVASTAFLGVLVGFYITDHLDNLIAYLIPFAAGGFIYIAASDLMPEIRKETNLKKSLISFGTFILGVAIMYATSLLE